MLVQWIFCAWWERHLGLALQTSYRRGKTVSCCEVYWTSGPQQPCQVLQSPRPSSNCEQFTNTFYCCLTYPHCLLRLWCRQHLSSGACLEDKRKDNQNCSVLCCVRQLRTMICTHMWAVLTFLGQLFRVNLLKLVSNFRPCIRSCARWYAVWPDTRSRSWLRALQSWKSFHFQKLPPAC